MTQRSPLLRRARYRSLAYATLGIVIAMAWPMAFGGPVTVWFAAGAWWPQLLLGAVVVNAVSWSLTPWSLAAIRANPRSWAAVAMAMLALYGGALVPCCLNLVQNGLGGQRGALADFVLWPMLCMAVLGTPWAIFLGFLVTRSLQLLAADNVGSSTQQEAPYPPGPKTNPRRPASPR